MALEYPAVLKYWFNFADCAFWYTRNASAEQVQYVEPQEDRTFLWLLSA